MELTVFQLVTTSASHFRHRWSAYCHPIFLELIFFSLFRPPTSCPPAIDAVRTRGESCGGEVTCVVRRCPKGLGTPVFDKLEAELAKAIMSLPATKVGTAGMNGRIETAGPRPHTVCRNGPASIKDCRQSLHPRSKGS